MRKLLLLSVLLLVLIVPSVSATPVDELTNLAKYFSVDTDFFVSVRSDAGYIETLDGLLARIDEAGNGQVFYGEYLNDMLSDGDGTFTETIAPWLGDSVALGATFGPYLQAEMMGMNSGNTPPILVAFSIDDAEAAEAFFDDMLGMEFMKATTEEGYISYTPSPNSFDDTEYALFDDVMLLWPASAQDSDTIITTALLAREPDAEVETETVTLADLEDFGATLAQLPQDDYNIVMYLNAEAVLAPMGEMVDEMMAMEGMNMGMSMYDIYQSIGSQAVGFTILDGRSLTIDFAQFGTDMSALNMGATPMNRGAVDMGFANFIPADVPLVIHDQGLGNQLLAQLESLEISARMMEEQGQTLSSFFESMGDYEAAALTENLDIGDIATFIRLAHRGMLGQDIEESYGWMSEDFATYMRIVPEDTLGIGLMVDLTTVVEVGDMDQASAFMEALPPLLDQLNIEYLTEDDTIILPFLNSLLFNFVGFSTPDLNLHISMNDDVFAIGTPGGVSFAMEPVAGMSLAEDANFQAAAEYFLDETQTVWYLTLEPLKPYVAGFLGSDPTAMQLLDLFESATITADYNDDGTGNARIVLTLSEAE